MIDVEKRFEKKKLSYCVLTITYDVIGKAQSFN